MKIKRMLISSLLVLCVNFAYSAQTMSSEEIIREFYSIERFQEIKVIWNLLTILNHRDTATQEQLFNKINRLFFEFYLDHKDMNISPLEVSFYNIFLNRLNPYAGFNDEPDNKELLPARKYFIDLLGEFEQDLYQVYLAAKQKDKIRHETVLTQAQYKLQMLILLNLLQTGRSEFQDFKPDWGVYRHQDLNGNNIIEISAIWIAAWMDYEQDLIQSLQQRLADQPENIDVQGMLTQEQKIKQEVMDNIAKISSQQETIYRLLASLEAIPEE